MELPLKLTATSYFMVKHRALSLFVWKQKEVSTIPYVFNTTHKTPACAVMREKEMGSKDQKGLQTMLVYATNPMIRSSKCIQQGHQTPRQETELHSPQIDLDNQWTHNQNQGRVGWGGGVLN